MDINRRTLLKSALVGGAVAGTAGLVACSNQSSDSAATASAGAITVSENEVTPLQLFASQDFNGQALFAAGAASSHTAEVGEVMRIVQTINEKTDNPADPTTENFDTFYNEFGAYADQLDKLAADSGSAHAISMRNRYLRSAMYAAQQVFFVLGTSDGGREQEIFQTCQDRWLQAMATFQPKMVSSKVKSQYGEIPVYFIPAPGSGRKPTVIISEGSDGQNVETMQFGVTAALDRGYNVVLFEGPGQMSLLFDQQITFTPNWDEVVGPVLNWTRKFPSVGKVGLIGISFGGMLCARAAAKLKLDAVVLEPGAYSMPLLWGDQESMKTVQETHSIPEAEKQKVVEEVNKGFSEAWGKMNRADQFRVYKRGEIFDKQVQNNARANQTPSNYYALLEKLIPFNFEQDYKKIRIPTMVTLNEGDQFFGDQGHQAFDWLQNVPANKKKFLDLTAAMGASMHDQPIGPQVAQEYVFDWLDEVM